MSAAPSRRLVDAIVTRDWELLQRCLAPDVWLRALLPRAVVEHRTAAEAFDTIAGWFARSSVFVPTWMEHVETVGGRARVGWRVELRPEWAPDTWHRVEQVGFCRVDGDRVRRLDLSCTGYIPLPAGLHETFRSSPSLVTADGGVCRP
jgi:hypothetical protein